MIKFQLRNATIQHHQVVIGLEHQLVLSKATANDKSIEIQFVSDAITLFDVNLAPNQCT